MKTLRELIVRYWNLAYAEGKEGRDHDTPNGDAQRVWHEIDGYLTDLERSLSKPVACMYPRIVSFKGVIRTSCPLELQPEIEGTVAWGPEVYVEDTSVVDKYGVVHNSYPLYRHPFNGNVEDETE